MEKTPEIKIAVIFYNFYNPIDKNLKKVNRLVSKLPGKAEVYIVSGKSEDEKYCRREKLILTDPDHKSFDISGYYTGLQSINKLNYDLFILFNESTFRKYSYQTIFNSTVQKIQFFKEVDIPFISGIIHKEKHLLSDKSNLLNSPYASTFFLILNKKSCKLYEDIYLKILNGSQLNDPIFEEFIDIHLFRSKNPYSWLASSNTNNETKYWKRKNVIFERLLSKELLEKGILINLIEKTSKRYKFKIIELIKKQFK